MKWNKTDPPKDRCIIRWHRIYQCLIVVFYVPPNTTEEIKCIWTTATLSQTWPENVFLPCWAEYPNERYCCC